MNNVYPHHHNFSFSGQGSRYFGIWAVNIILTVLTLGLYYPWAKAAIRRFLWNETSLDGDPFVYHGTGKEMFKGFIMAYGLIFCMILMVYLFPMAVILFYIGLILLGPIAIFGAWRYRLSRTSWRGIFFSFRGNLTDFVKLYLKNLFLTIFTLGIYGSWMRVNIMTYLMSHSQFGQYRLDFRGSGGELFGINLGGIILSIITLYIYLPWYIANSFNFTINNIEVEQEDESVYNLKSTLSGGNTFYVIFTNLLMLMFTFGLAFPWVAMRTQKLFTESVNVPEEVDLENLQQDADDYRNATGDDLLDILDIDIV
ncbi:MAG: YjgN family protein [Saprospiraceae bacterium]